jgi:uridine kinase
MSSSLPRWPTAGPLVIGIAGGSGSGKTTIARSVVESIGREAVVLIQHDAYYRDQSQLAVEERAKVNYDHPDSLETDLLVAHLSDLLAGGPVRRPVYDFTVHNRSLETVLLEPKPVILVEGILVLYEPALRELMDLRIYIDTDPDLRIVRRLERDITERGRSFESVRDQYLETVRPMHLQFVEPSKRYADIVIPEGYSRFRRVSVVGATGTGKSTLASRLAAALGVAHVELDALHWEPGWNPADPDVLRARVAAAVTGDGWVIDGSYSDVQPLVWERAEAVVWLDYRFPVMFGRLLGRTARRIATGEALWNGNTETLRRAALSRDSILWWQVRSFRKLRRRYPALLADPRWAHVQVVRLRSPRQAERWLDALWRAEAP